eukprot:jgi/Galph1/3485/GphlegSOOS_G2130.1
MISKSKLDRLLELLEQGGNTNIRRIAAEQLSHLVSQHPAQITQVIDRITDIILYNKSWTSRVSAAHALGAIASQLPKQAKQDKTNTDVELNCRKRKRTGEKIHFLSLESLNMETILKNGGKLLGSSGKQFILEAEKDTSAQFSELPSLLGMYSMTEDIVSVEDLEQKNLSENKDWKPELNILLESDEWKNVHNPLETMPNEEAESTIEENQWIFSNCCLKFINNLFALDWEVRHGATTGLREVLKYQASEAHLSDIYSSQVNERFLQDIACRLMILLSVDRFCDFSGSLTVAPVKEAAAMALATIVMQLKAPLVEKIGQFVIRLSQSSQWEVAHGAYVTMRYIFATLTPRVDIVSSLLNEMFENILKGIISEDEDICAAAAQCLYPVMKIITRLDSETSHISLERLCNTLWKVIESCDEWNAGALHCLELICQLYTNLQRNGLIETQHLFSGHICQIFPFMLHHNVSIRQAALSLTISVLEDEISCEKSLFPEEQIVIWFSFVIGWLYIEQNDCFVDKICDILSNWLDRKQNWNFSTSFILQMLELCHQQSMGHCLPIIESILGSCKLRVISGFLEVANKVIDDEKRRGDKEGRFLRFQQHVCRLTSLLLQGDVENSPLYKATIEQLLSSSSISCWTAACHIIRYWYPLSSLTEKEDCLDSLMKRMRQLESSAPNNIIFQEETVEANQLFSDILIVCKKVPRQSIPRKESIEELVRICEQGQQAWKEQNWEHVARIALKIRDEYLSLLHQMIEWIHHRNISEKGASYNTLEAMMWRICGHLNQLQVFRTQLIIQAQAMVVCSIVWAKNWKPHTMSVSQWFAHRVPNLTEKISPYMIAMLNGIRYSTCTFIQQLCSSTLAWICQLLVHIGRKKSLEKLCENLFNHLFMAFRKKEEGTCDNNFVELDGILLAWKELCCSFADKLFTALPKVYQLGLSVLENLQGESSESDEAVERALCFVIHTFKWWDISLYPLCRKAGKAMTLQSACLVDNTHNSNPHIVDKASLALAEMISCCPRDFMSDIIRYLLPIIDSHRKIQRSEQNILSALKTIQRVVIRLDSRMVPFVSLFLTPLITQMTQQNLQVRLIASEVFGMLLRLLPLESESNSSDEVFDEEWWMDNEDFQQDREEARLFLYQLLGWRPREPYHLPVALPEGIHLREYQQQGLEWLAFLNRYGLHGALCDDMGLGKTLMTLSIIVGDTVEWERHGIHKQSLVIAPASVVTHWYEESQKFFGKYLSNVILYLETARKRQKLVEKFSSATLIITSYEIIRTDRKYFHDISWNYLVLDEGHVIRNHHSKTAAAVKSLSAAHRLILSGTPIQNSVKDLWSLFDFLMPGFLGEEKAFEERLVRPIIRGKSLHAEENERERSDVLLETLHRQVLPFILRRMKGDVLKELPPKIIQNYFSQLTHVQEKLYQVVSEMLLTASKEELEGEQKTKTIHIFAALRCLQQICTHPLLLLDSGKAWVQKVVRNLNLEDKGFQSWKMSAKFQSLYELFTELGLVSHDDSEDKDEEQHQPKANNDRDIQVPEWEISDDFGHRVLLFAQTKKSLDIMEKLLFIEGPFRHLSYLRLEGSISPVHRQAIVTRFNSDPSISCMLLTTQVGGLGLNLTGADTVIFLEQDWNPVRDMQAMDRAHRIGQKRTVNVARLITKATLEEKIAKLQEVKTAMAESVVNRDNSSLQNLSNSELLDLFQFEPSSNQEGESFEETKGNTSTFGAGSYASVLRDLTELWDEDEYTSEFDWSHMLEKGLTKEQ